MTTTSTSTSKPGSQQTNTAPAPIFWPTWVPPTLPTAMPVMSPQYGYALVAGPNGNRLAAGTAYQWTQTAKPGLVGSSGSLEVYAGQVVGAGAQTADLSLSSGSTMITNLAGAFVQMEGPSTLHGTTSLTANALHYGSFQLLGGSETLTINQAKSSTSTAPSGVPALIVSAGGEKSASGTDTISITTATLASTSATTPDVFVHLGAQIANVAVGGSGAAVIVGGASALNLHDSSGGGTLLTFGSGETIAWGGSGHNVYAVLAADPITTGFIYDFKGAGGAKAASVKSDPFAQSGADTLEVSASLQARTSVSTMAGGTMINFGPGHNLLLCGVTGFKPTDITWLAGS